ncbi:MAG: zinc ribbon domain-containing protein [Theionarchaea archaeon]|nr:zinc ribbon domain-containing protein [Theionarchaea archaeon]MBU7037977.1 zinc ribbon domain-containing protein [Theionarchaea archaeon]
MAEPTCIEIELPEFMNLLEAEVRKKLIEEVSDKIRPAVSDMFSTEVRKILAEKIDAFRTGSGESREESVERKEPERVESPDSPHTAQKSLTEEILSLPEEEAFQKLRLSLAQGEIDEPTFNKLKGLISSRVPQESLSCKKCGKELEPTAKFCRFCGTRIR